MKPVFFPEVAAISFEVAFGDIDLNCERVREILAELHPVKGSMVVLPELWAHGFDYRHTEALSGCYGDLVEFLSTVASHHGVYLAGSVLEPANPGPAVYNTLCVVGPTGLLGSYRKQNLFSYWREDEFFTPGDGYAPITTPHGMVGGMVCYDLRFPVVARDQAFYGSDLLIVSAQWPLSRLDHWKSLLRARAIENQVYLVAANSCGTTGGTILGGHAIVVGPTGMVLAETGEEQGVAKAQFDPKDIELARRNFCSVARRGYPGRHLDKVVSLAKANEVLTAIRQQGSKIAFTNGCFDILHAGHVEYLEQARKSADYLVVGLNSDRSVRGLKGDSRPVNPQEQRAGVLAGLGSVDMVIIFDDETPATLITTLLPDVLVKGADWPEDEIVGAPEVKANGGKVLRIPFSSMVSTTKVIEKIKGNS